MEDINFVRPLSSSIHSSASANAENIFGDDRKPNGRVLSAYIMLPSPASCQPACPKISCLCGLSSVPYTSGFRARPTISCQRGQSFPPSLPYTSVVLRLPAVSPPARKSLASAVRAAHLPFRIHRWRYCQAACPKISCQRGQSCPPYTSVALRLPAVSPPARKSLASAARAVPLINR